ncbi:MAG TPA: sugar phosphate isomerase/epimerase, partial [Pirellulaceae bacterium]|nr:sugar phosphate isomerase/epimerase [Pirellulaceae bacterium]
ALVAEVGSPHLGLCLDVFHFYCGPSKGEDLGYLTRDNLFHVQLSDLADVPRELATDGDRILPGDGDLPLTMIVGRLREIGYAGPVSVELMNPHLWQVPARQFGEIALTALRRLLGMASMV